jgi:hypothetical protein
MRELTLYPPPCKDIKNICGKIGKISRVLPKKFTNKYYKLFHITTYINIYYTYL